ncbi:MAG: ABC transporter ATP-binding protein [Hyphomicrobiaceae bacterium]
MADTIVSIEGVRKSFQRIVAVDGVSLTVGRGEFVSLLGPSGCGKTTLLRMLAGFEAPDEGRIAIDGADVVSVPPHLRPVNMVFQSYALFPHLTVFDNLAFGLRRKRVPSAEVSRSVNGFLALVGLEDYALRFPSQLSGGQQQRVALARVLVNKPKVLLLDEPLAALDLKLRKRMQLELKQLQREVGISFVFVTHDQDEALALSDKVAVMNGGRLLQYDTCREIYDRPRTEFVANFLGEANILSARLVERGAPTLLEISGRRIAVSDAGEAHGALSQSVLLALRPEDVSVAGSAQEGVNALPAAVTDKMFLGNSCDLFLRTDDGVAVLSRGLDRDAFDRIAVGDRVEMSWKPTSGRIVAP